MIRKYILAVTVVLALSVPQTGFSQEPLTGKTPPGVIKSTVQDQKNVAVTVYNNNLALIKDTREIDLPNGQAELRFMDVAAHIMPVTVLIKSLNDPDKFSVLEQNYEYDLISPRKLMDKYVGKKIKIIDYNAYQDKKEILEATLLSNNEGEIYRINDEIFIGHAGYKVLPEIPANLIAKPTLTWLYANSAKRPHRLEVSYLTNNLNWKADYVMSVNDSDTLADLSGWVTLDNKSGATYTDAKLKLVAGEVNRVADSMSRAKAGRMEFAMAAEAPGFVEKSFFEYHIYDLQRPTTIKDNQTKQVSLLEAGGVKVEKEMTVRGNQYYYYSSYAAQKMKTPVEVYIKFKNSQDNNVGMPLPAGTVRLYKADSDKSLQFIGEDAIEHTPKDEEVKLRIGEAFDVVSERVQTDFKIVASNVYESAWEISLRNHKKEAVTVGVVEPLTADWQILESTHSYNKENAFTIRFDVPVAPDEEVKVKYRARVRTH